MSKENLSVSRSIKGRHAKSGKALSLKAFVRALIAAGDQPAKDWLANKGGMFDESRSEKNRLRVTAERSASKVARRKSKNGGGAPKAA